MKWCHRGAKGIFHGLKQKGPQIIASAARPCATGVGGAAPAARGNYLLVGLLRLSDPAGIGHELGSVELAPAMRIPAFFQVVD